MLPLDVPIFNHLQDDTIIDALRDIARTLQQRFQRIYIFGTGGSIMTGKALADIAPPHAVTFVDNIDPDGFQSVLDDIDYATSGFVIISKSGQTTEILTQLLTLLAVWPQHIASQDHFLIITQAHDSPLMQYAQQFQWQTIVHPPEVPGRYSAFTAVGLLPCLLLGLDPVRFRAGATELRYHDESTELFKRYQQGVHTHVLFSYSDRIQGLLYWWRQLVAESLGKTDTAHVLQGVTPIVAQGTMDQHSQLQLYLDGPRDKFFTFLTFDARVQLPLIELTSMRQGTQKNINMNTVFESQYKATMQALKTKDCPVRHLHFPVFDEYILGQTMMRFMLEVIRLADQMGVNPFDQPAVELGKNLAKDYLK